MSCAQSPATASRRKTPEGEAAKASSRPRELSHLCSRVSFGGCLLGWAAKAEGNPVGAFAWLLSLLSPQSPESPPPSQAQNRKEGSRGSSFRRTARKPPTSTCRLPSSSLQKHLPRPSPGLPEAPAGGLGGRFLWRHPASLP